MLVGWTNAQVQEEKQPPSTLAVASRPPEGLATRLSGRVIDAKSQEPIPKASLTLHQLLSHGTVSKAVLQTLSSDGNGNFLFDPIPEVSNEPGKGNAFLLSVQCEGKSSHVRFIAEPEHVANPLAISLTEPEIVAGQVVNERGEPIAGAKVFYGGFRSKPFPDNVFCATTDDDGRYAIQDLGARPEKNSPEARYFFGNEIHVQHPDYYQQSAQRFGISRQVNWKLSKAGSLTGRVLESSNNSPVANVSVVAYIPFPDGNSERINYLAEHKAVTDAQGNYHFSGLKPDKYNVTVSLPDCAMEAVESVEVESERTAQARDMVLSDECWIEGEVVNAKTGAPVPYCFDSTNPILVEIAGASHPSEGGQTPTVAVDKEGKFRIRVAPGKAFVSISPGNFRFTGSETSGGITTNRISHLQDFLVDKDLHRRGIVVKPHETAKVRLQLDLPDGK
ncbi:MAG: carboxypeptidase regulatory-like domain-containing protein [Pirellulales bacterium]